MSKDSTRRVSVLIALFVFCWLALGCGPALAPTKTEVEAPSVARVQLTAIEDNIFKFMVYNLSDQPMVILRDEVLLQTPSGSRHRLPGGYSNVYNLAPGESHAVHTRFDLTNIESGDTLEVHFGPAVQIRGKPTQIEPILIQVE
jgi:hypothetical protein